MIPSKIKRRNDSRIVFVHTHTTHRLCDVISVALSAASDRATLHPSRLVSASWKMVRNAPDELVRDIYEAPRNQPNRSQADDADPGRSTFFHDST